MHAILKPSHTNRGQISQSKLNRVSGLMRTQITRVQDHHRSRLEAADGNHPLVRLVYSFLFSPHQEPMAVYEWAVENEVELAQAVGFSNSIQHRNPLESVCYPDCDEYWVTHRPSHIRMTFNGADEILLNTTPVTVLYQPYILPVHYIPKGGKGSSHWAVIGVDIPALALMYQAWMQYNEALPAGQKQSIEQFVCSYVLPGMLVSQANSVRLNMLTRYMDDSVPKLDTRSNIGMTDHTDELQAILHDIIVDSDSRNYPLGYLYYLIGAIQEGQSLLDNFPHIAAPEVFPLYTCRYLAAVAWVRTATMLELSPSDVREYGQRVRAMSRQVRARFTHQQLGKGYVDKVESWHSDIVNLLT